MTWPNIFGSARDIPHEGGDEAVVDMSRTTNNTLTNWAERNHDLLDALTAGDVGKETLLGSLLIDLSTVVGNNESFAAGDRRPIQR